jgi:hypothetical protein
MSRQNIVKLGRSFNYNHHIKNQNTQLQFSNDNHGGGVKIFRSLDDQRVEDDGDDERKEEEGGGKEEQDNNNNNNNNNDSNLFSTSSSSSFLQNPKEIVAALIGKSTDLGLTNTFVSSSSASFIPTNDQQTNGAATTTSPITLEKKKDEESLFATTKKSSSSASSSSSNSSPKVCESLGIDDQDTDTKSLIESVQYEDDETQLSLALENLLKWTPIAIPIFAFVLYDPTALLFSRALQSLSWGNTWVAVDGGQYQARIITPAINGIVVQAIAILFAVIPLPICDNDKRKSPPVSIKKRRNCVF